MNWEDWYDRIILQPVERRNAFRNVKQIDFVHAAEKFNIKLGKSHMSQYVSGKTVPRADIAHFLAAFLQVNEDWLMGKDVPMEQNPAALPAIESDETRHDSNPASAQSKEGKTMRTFAKSHKLDNVLYDVRGPVADEAARMEAAGTHILKLNIGNPAPFGFRTPDEVVYDMAQQLPETEGYSPSKGLFSARKAIMQYAQLKNIPNVSIDDIFTGNGVSELINLFAVRIDGQRATSASAFAGLSSVDRLREFGRRHRRALYL